MDKNLLKWCLCFGACAVLAGCAPHSTEDRLASMEMQMQGQQVLDMRLSHVEAKIERMEEDLGVIRAAVTGGNEKGRKVAPRPVAPQPAPPVSSPAPVAPVAEKKAAPDAPAQQPSPVVATSEKQAPLAETQHQPLAASGKEPLGAAVQTIPVADVDLAQFSNELPSYLGSYGEMLVDRGPEPAVAAMPAKASPAVKSSKSVAAKAQPASQISASPTGQADYDAALATYEAKRYKQAEERFAAFLAKHPGHKLAPNAKYWLGESYYGSGQFTTAIVTFKEVVTQYPTHPKAAAALLKIGFAYAQLKDMENARFYWNILLEDFPGTAPASMAKQRLAGMQ